MTVKGGKKCHICLERKRTIVTCEFCGHNTCISPECLIAVLQQRMCWKCQMNPYHRTRKDVLVG
ncbi:hypothetical protein LCGC14_2672780 [marine sediment metagenome]|uniref:Uncharacterized protein n=1 Tax=marine sediment metagenome TaxID=412755 RepID=A0A0F8ZNK6_9ZZZZ